MLIRIVKMTFAPERVNDFIAEFNRRKSYIAGFAGCNGVDLLQDLNSPNIFFTYSKWDNAAHLETYRNSELFGETWDTVKKWFIDKPEAWSLELISR